MEKEKWEDRKREGGKGNHESERERWTFPVPAKTNSHECSKSFFEKKASQWNCLFWKEDVKAAIFCSIGSIIG